MLADVTRGVLIQCGPRVAPFALVVTAIGAGYSVDRIRPVSLIWSGGLGAALLVATCVALILHHRFATKSTGAASDRRRYCSAAFTIALVAAAFSLAAAWHHCRWHLVRNDQLCRLAPSDGLTMVPVHVRGTAVSLVSHTTQHEIQTASSERTSFQMKVSEVQVGAGQWCLATGKVWVHVAGDVEDLRTGDRIRLSGQLGRFRGPMNPAERDRRAARRGDGLHCFINVSNAAAIRMEGRPEGTPRWWLSRLRIHWDTVLVNRLEPAPYAVATAMLLGRRDRLSAEQRDPYFRTGTIHLLAISGLHVGILASFFLFAARGRLVPFRGGLVAVIVLMLVYAQLTESRAPVLRASILVQLMCLGWLTRRRSSLVNSLAIAAIIVLVCQPSDLFAVGAQLSFLAVVTLASIGRMTYRGPPQDPLDRWLWRTQSATHRWLTTTRVRIVQMVVVSFIVWAVTAPLVWHHFHLVSPIAVVVNCLLWLPLAAALFSGFAILLLERRLEWAAGTAATICNVSLKLIERVVDWFDRLPCSHFWLVSPGTGAVVIFYAALFVLAFARTPRVRFQCVLVACLTLVVGFTWQISQRWRNESLVCTFLSVGHGTCVVIELPDGQVWLYDAGRMGSVQSGVDLVSRFLWSRGISTIDTFVLSHLDVDHFSLLPGICERFKIGQAVVSQSLLARRPQAMRARRILERHAIPIRHVIRGERWLIGADCELGVLHPVGERMKVRDNENSLVLLIRRGDVRILLPGDLEGDAVQQLMKDRSPQTVCVMAPHHGSLASPSVEFAMWSHCSEWIVSGGNPRAFPVLRRRFAPRQVRVWHTAIHGAIQFAITPGGAQVSAFRADVSERWCAPTARADTWSTAEGDDGAIADGRGLLFGTD